MEDVLEVKPSVIATGCPFCNTMMTDGVKHFEQEHTIAVKDIAELIAEAVDL
jgi:Fe-S oxidoreductase